ncbi:unnamed protein product [Acidithrix sp. C25]|nr:unnamed protein product [Acidithrix sp. C25]
MQHGQLSEQINITKPKGYGPGLASCRQIRDDVTTFLPQNGVE